MGYSMKAIWKAISSSGVVLLLSPLSFGQSVSFEQCQAIVKSATPPKAVAVCYRIYPILDPDQSGTSLPSSTTKEDNLSFLSPNALLIKTNDGQTYVLSEVTTNNGLGRFRQLDALPTIKMENEGELKVRQLLEGVSEKQD